MNADERRSKTQGVIGVHLRPDIVIPVAADEGPVSDPGDGR
jgi:hypothetical protein